MRVTGGNRSSSASAITASHPRRGAGIPHYYESFRYAYEHFLDRCIAKGEAPLSTIDDALDVERFIEAIEHGLERGEDAATAEYGRARDLGAPFACRGVTAPMPRR